MLVDLKLVASEEESDIPRPLDVDNVKAFAMNLFLLSNASSKIDFQALFRSETGPRPSAKLRDAWSVASPKMRRSASGRDSVSASKLAALQRPATARSCSRPEFLFRATSSLADSGVKVVVFSAQSATDIRFYVCMISCCIPCALCLDRGLTLVNVPVLSEQTTDTAPRVSTVLSDLHRILFFFIRFAVIVKLAVTAMGSPSGM